jgi:2-polyprenyl-3-methyl-5-hydroxy-6-metoxy-1,4-benzoquinol methylase
MAMGIFSKVKMKLDFLKSRADKKEVDTLYKLLYHLIHDLDNSLDISSEQTKESFGFQWDQLSSGEYMLSDPWFKNSVERIICEEETRVKKEWFEGKNVLDAGCGGGRWSYGLAKLGALVTAVDINDSALYRTREALEGMGTSHNFIKSPLESLDEYLGDEKFDLVWSWGVVHHCKSFNKSFEQLCNRVKEGGMIYLYLYGRESVDFQSDINLFKDRLYYNTLPSWEEKEIFLIEKGGGDPNRIHQMHDIYSPLLNRRLEFNQMEELLLKYGFSDITRTNSSTELHIRAVKGQNANQVKEYFLPPFEGTSWMAHHES